MFTEVKGLLSQFDKVFLFGIVSTSICLADGPVAPCVGGRGSCGYTPATSAAPLVQNQGSPPSPFVTIPTNNPNANRNQNNSPFSNLMNSGSGLGGPGGQGKNAYSPDYSDYNDHDGNYHTSKSNTVSRSTKPSGPGHHTGLGKNDYRCDNDSTGMVLTGTFYNLPHEDKPDSWGSYSTFMDWAHKGSSYNGRGGFSRGAVNVEGSGICDGTDERCPKNWILHYTGKAERNPCASGFFGEASTPAGYPLKAGEEGIEANLKPGSPNCLVPFFSVAGDIPRKGHDGSYPRGTIIEVPEMKGRKVCLPPDGRTCINHPGLFMIQDTGEEITGPNRFDFFTGSYEQKDQQNIFGNSSVDPDMQMDIKSCRNHVRAIKPNDPEYQTALKTLRLAVANANHNGSGSGEERTPARD